jgi:hypothetical protein
MRRMTQIWDLVARESVVWHEDGGQSGKCKSLGQLGMVSLVFPATTTSK